LPVFSHKYHLAQINIRKISAGKGQHMEVELNHENNAAPNRLKQIQDLMFKEYIDEWDKKLKTLYRHIKELEGRTSHQLKLFDKKLQNTQNELKEEFAKERKETRATLESFQIEMTKKINLLLNNNKVEKESLGKFLIQLGEKVRNDH
jgi:deoxyribodipyrimidine photolyase-like uncharacterized protein